MMETTDVLVVGGSAAGLVAAQVGRATYPEKQFLVVRDTKAAVIPCAIPYVFGELAGTEKNILPDALATKSGATVMHGRVASIDRENKRCTNVDGTVVQYDKLVIATGSNPRIPSWLTGADLANVYVVPKNKEYVDSMLSSLADKKNVVVIGAGFIGVELADQLQTTAADVTLVEVLPHILGMAFDTDIALEAEALLKKKGIHLYTGVGVKEIVGNGTVTAVQLADGQTVAADAVVLAMGYAPESTLAREAGLPVNDRGFIVVDEYMRTSDPDVVAIGDCAEKRDFITRRPSGVMLASTACAEARVAATNLFGISSLKVFNGTIAVYSTALDDTGFGMAGITEAAAKREGFDVVTGSFTGVDRHPGAMNAAHSQTVNLVVSRDAGTIIGGGVIGGISAGELTNVLGVIIQNRMSVNDVLTTQFGTQPCLTASPAAYPLVKAAEEAAGKL